MTQHSTFDVHTRTDFFSLGARLGGLFALALAGLTATEARAGCEDGKVGGCEMADGCPGTHECNGGKWSSCEPIVEPCNLGGCVGVSACHDGVISCEPPADPCDMANGCPGELTECVGGDWACEPVPGDKVCTVCGGTGSQQCNGAGQVVTACATLEVCNFCDDDADGEFDDGLGCLPVQNCEGGEEFCEDDIDNDCDDKVDEDCKTPDLTLGHVGEGGFSWLQWTTVSRSGTDLGALYWPKLAPPELVIGGEVNRIRVGDGTIAWVCTKKYFGGDCDALNFVGGQFIPWGREVYSYERFRTGDFELWNTVEPALWPDDTEPADDANWDNVATHVQGLAHDDDSWFVSRQGALYKIPLSADLEDEDNLIWTERTYIPTDYDYLDHIGDIDQFEGIVFAPLELAGAKPGDAAPVIAMFDADDLSLLDVKYFPNTQFRAGWVAINPVDGLLYSGDEGHAIHVYEWRGDATELQYLYTIDLPANVPGFGGGNGLAFSESGHMYGASSVDDWGKNPVYLWVFHLVGRELTFNKSTLLIDDLTGIAQGVLEGIDVMRTDLMGNIHPMLTGEVHVLVWNDDFDADNWTIIHAEVDDSSRI